MFTSHLIFGEPPGTVRDPDLEPCPFPGNTVLFNSYPGYCQDFSGQEQAHAGILSHTPFEDLTFLPGVDANTIILENKREPFIGNAGIYRQGRNSITIPDCIIDEV